MTTVENEELAEYKAKVRAIALRLADEHGWCGVIDNALVELETTPCRAEEIWNDMTYTVAEANAEVEYFQDVIGEVALVVRDTVSPLTKWVLANHDEHHTGVARFCQEMCRLADQAVEQIANLDVLR
jgi:hypothetical protein